MHRPALPTIPTARARGRPKEGREEEEQCSAVRPIAAFGRVDLAPLAASPQSRGRPVSGVRRLPRPKPEVGLAVLCGVTHCGRRQSRRVPLIGGEDSRVEAPLPLF
jgi:hypothetical protein